MHPAVSRALLRCANLRLSKQYGVSLKTIRDIWNHKSWAFATRHLWVVVFEPMDVQLRGDPFHCDWPHWLETSNDV